MMSAPPVRPFRPANRRALIADAAGRAFAARGYHAVAMEDIAAAVGITAAALYRHFPNKYALFVECATQLADGLASTLDALPRDAALPVVLGAIARTTVANRATGGIYRWEARYLADPERRALRRTFSGVVEQVAEHISTARPDGASLSTSDLRLVSAAALGAIGSATAHRTSVGARRLESVLTTAAHQVALAPLTAPPLSPAPMSTKTVAPDAGTRRSQILEAAIPLFHRDGYAEVSMGAIAAAVGLTPSGLYRHYTGKADILLAACLQAADVLAATVEREMATATGPTDALHSLAGAYVGYSFEHTALTSVATAESGGLPPETQRPLRAAQREHVARWEAHLLVCRPTLDTVQARLLAHAALGVVTEAGRALHWSDSAENRARVTGWALAALGV